MVALQLNSGSNCIVSWGLPVTDLDPWLTNMSLQPMVSPYILTQCVSCYLTKVSSSWKVSRDVKDRTEWVFLPGLTGSLGLIWMQILTPSQGCLEASVGPLRVWGNQLLALSLSSSHFQFHIFLIFGLKFCWRLKRLMFKLNSSSLEQIKTFIKSRIFQQMVVLEIGFSGNCLPGFQHV